jgi:nitrite reductase/ring-hydroxylating ferredoxin subunit
VIPGAALCRLEELPEGGVREVGAGLIAWRSAGEVRVFVNRCPHFRIALNAEPGEFKLHGGLLMCVHHYSYFSFPHGRCVGGPCEGEPLESVAIRIEDQTLYLD